MTGKDLRKIREDLGVSPLRFGRAIGTFGETTSVQKTMWRYESGNRTIPHSVAILALIAKRNRYGLKILEDAAEQNAALYIIKVV